MNTRDRLETLMEEADAQAVRFEKRRRNRAAFAKGLNVTIAITALLVGVSSATSAPVTLTVALATLLLITVAVNLAATNTEVDHHVQQIAATWQHHWSDAARLLSQGRANVPAETARQIQRETTELEHRVAETREHARTHGLGHDTGNHHGNNKGVVRSTQ